MESKFDVLNTITEWADSGRIVSKSSCKLSPEEFEERVKSGRIMQTSITRIIATDTGALREFERLIEEGRILTSSQLAIKLNLQTTLAVRMAVANKDLLKFNGFGNWLTLYIK